MCPLSVKSLMMLHSRVVSAHVSQKKMICSAEIISDSDSNEATSSTQVAVVPGQMMLQLHEQDDMPGIDDADRMVEVCIMSHYKTFSTSTNFA